VVIRQLTAKTNLKLHDFWEGQIELHEWKAGNGYKATFERGAVTLQSEQGKVVIHNPHQVDEVRENFIFWGGDQE
jgi:hypothetical protein